MLTLIEGIKFVIYVLISGNIFGTMMFGGRYTNED